MLSSDLRDLPVPAAFDHKVCSSPPSCFYTIDLFVLAKTSHCRCLRGFAPVPGTLCLVPSRPLGKDLPCGWSGEGVLTLAGIISLQSEGVRRADS